MSSSESDSSDTLKSYIISLKKPIDKIRYLKTFGLRAKWFRGINGDTAEEPLISKYVSKFYKNFGPKSAIGCAISHIKAWELAIIKNNKYTLIFEDDVILNPDFKKNIDGCLKNAPRDFDILYLGGLGVYHTTFVHYIISLLLCQKSPKAPEYVNDFIKRPSVITGLHGYIISQTGAKKLVSFIKGHVNNHIDSYINSLYQKGILNIYITHPELAYQTSTCNITNSQNVKSNFPFVINTFASKFLIDKYVTADYGLTISLLRLGPFNINVLCILFLIGGIIACKFYKQNLFNLTAFFIALLIPDLLYNPQFSNKKIIQIIFYYILLIGYKLTFF